MLCLCSSSGKHLVTTSVETCGVAEEVLHDCINGVIWPKKESCEKYFKEESSQKGVLRWGL